MEYTITRINDNDELMHYGVKGMKWGKRKANYYGEGKSTFRASNGQMVGAPNSRGVEAFRKVAGTKIGGAAVTGMARMQGKQAANTVRKEVQAVRESNQAHKQAMKQAKKERKDSIKSTYKDIEKQSSIGDKILYNDATRRKAAKYVVDNKMSVQDARKKANKEAIRNTAAFMAAYGAVTIGVYRSMK